MGTPSTIASYQAELEVLSTALISNPLFYRLPTNGQAIHFRLRCYSLRKLLRDEGDLRFEPLIFTLPKGSNVLEIAVRKPVGQLLTQDGTVIEPVLPAPITLSEDEIADLVPPDSFSLEGLK